MRQPLNAYKYALTLLITVVIFGIIFYINNVLDSQRIDSVKAVQDQISLDILSSETQFNLLKDASCKNVDMSILSQEINSIAAKLAYLESNNGDKQPAIEVTNLKKYYSLLQIKDFMLMKQLGDKCSSKPISVLYFYGKSDACPDCERMAEILTYLRSNYPELRIYSFDTDLELSAINTLKSIYGITAGNIPAIVYNDESYIGFRTIEEMKQIIPALKKIDIAKAAAKAASSTAATAAAKATSVKARGTQASTTATKK